eukprot:TRINITY_DN46_c0_g1_i1.p1 TRINITY_DN46_c0_g1~~TRINITY_DN46_c0_g1_i1.p1  ORF type:complete len:159 (-),score=5.90 TRINITY_DN46_c0_g1_i1:195-671(-)
MERTDARTEINRLYADKVGADNTIVSRKRARLLVAVHELSGKERQELEEDLASFDDAGKMTILEGYYLNQDTAPRKSANVVTSQHSYSRDERPLGLFAWLSASTQTVQPQYSTYSRKSLGSSPSKIGFRQSQESSVLSALKRASSSCFGRYEMADKDE